MTEPVEALRTLVDAPPSPPEPVAELHRRVEARQRRRRRRRAVLAAVAAVLAVMAVVPLLDRPSDPTTRVLAGPGPSSERIPAPESPSTTAPLEFVAGQPISSRIDFTVPAGWQTLLAVADRMVVATRPLSDADRTLAELARNDTAFTAFPADGVVVVVGNDPVEPKYLLAQDGSTVGPGPPFGLGPEKVLAGGVRVRRGDVPQSGVKIASYAGPSAPAARVAEAETIAAGIRLVRTGDPSVRPPPPPDGSRPGLPMGTLPVPEDGLPEVARAAASGSTVVLVAGRDCAYLRWVDAQRSLPSYQPLAGACGTRQRGTTIEAFGSPVMLRRAPGTVDSMAVIFRAGPDVDQVSVRLADGRRLPGVIGAEGWGVAVGEGRIVSITGVATGGRSLGETFVG
ncbi:MAG: hypothetical protein ACRD1D_05830 [Acidimicrobiales bacterium]